MNVIRQAYAANVYKVIMLSSFSTVFTTHEELYDDSRVFTEKGVYDSLQRRTVLHHLVSFFPMLDWRKVSKEDVKPDTPNWDVYAASKTLAERAAWDFAESHPDLDLTTRKSLFLVS